MVNSVICCHAKKNITFWYFVPEFLPAVFMRIKSSNIRCHFASYPGWGHYGHGANWGYDDSILISFVVGTNPNGFPKLLLKLPKITEKRHNYSIKCCLDLFSNWLEFTVDRDALTFMISRKLTPTLYLPEVNIIPSPTRLSTRPYEGQKLCNWKWQAYRKTSSFPSLCLFALCVGSFMV